MRNVKKYVVSILSILLILFAIVPVSAKTKSFEEQVVKRTIYFENSANWKEVYAYFWSSDDQSMTMWPGDSMTLVYDKIFSVEIPENAEYIIFNDSYDQTADLDITNIYDLYTYSSDMWSNYDSEENIVDLLNEKIIYFWNSDNWKNPTAYFWGEAATISWPGVGMMWLSGSVYKVVVPKSATSIIFSDKGKNQTDDILIEDNYNMYVQESKTWGVYNDSVKVYYVLGDTSLDNRVNIFDATSLQYHIAGLNELTPVAKLAADADLDKVLTIRDVTDIQAYLSYSGNNDFIGKTFLQNNSENIIAEKTITLSANNFSNPYAYYWSADNKNMVAWPGVPMQKNADGTCSVTMSSEADHIIFSDKGNEKTQDLEITGNCFDYKTQTWNIIYNPSVKEETDDYTVTFTNNLNWNNVCCYAWNSETLESDEVWPGKKMNFFVVNKYGEDIYTTKIPKKYDSVIFTDGKSQTVDIITNSQDHKYYIFGKENTKYTVHEWIE